MLLLSGDSFILLLHGVLISFVIVTRHAIGQNAVNIEVLRELVQYNHLGEGMIANWAVQPILPEDRVCHSSDMVAKGRRPQLPQERFTEDLYRLDAAGALRPCGLHRSQTTGAFRTEEPVPVLQTAVSSRFQQTDDGSSVDSGLRSA